MCRVRGHSEVWNSEVTSQETDAPFDWWLNGAWLCTQRELYWWKELKAKLSKHQTTVVKWPITGCRICPQHIEINLQFGWSNCLHSGQCCHLGICSACSMILCLLWNRLLSVLVPHWRASTYEKWRVGWIQKSAKETMKMQNRQPYI